MPKFPQTVGKKPNHAVIYHRANGQFTVKWKQGASWLNKTKSDYKSALALAKEISQAKGLERLPRIILSPLEVEEYIYCKSTSAEAGVGPQQAIQEWKEAKAYLPKGFSLLEVVKAHARSIEVKDLEVHELVDSWAREKYSRGSTPKYLRNVEVFRKRIKLAFHTTVRSLDAGMLIEWLESTSQSLDFSAKTFNDNVTFLKSLIQFAINHAYLPADSRLGAALPMKKLHRNAASYLDPEEFEAIYAKAHQRIRGRLFLIAFYGLRPEEACEFTVSDGLKENSVIVDHKSAKTGWRRSIPIEPSSKKYLAQNVENFDLDKPLSGNSYQHYQKQVMPPGRKNALRHSFISYHLALHNNLAQLAYLSGTSPEKIRSNYLELVTVEAATRWFELRQVFVERL